MPPLLIWHKATARPGHATAPTCCWGLPYQTHPPRGLDLCALVRIPGQCPQAASEIEITSTGMLGSEVND